MITWHLNNNEMNNFVSYTIKMLQSLKMYNKQFERKKTPCDCIITIIYVL